VKLAAKSVYAIFFLLTSIYGLLAYVPFTFQQVIKGALFPPLNEFGRIQPYLFWIVLLIIAPAVGVVRTRASTIFLCTHILLGIYLIRWPVLVNLENTGASLRWGIASLAPIVWLAALDWQEYFPSLEWRRKTPDEERPAFHAAWQSAAFLTVVYALIGLYKHPAGEWSAAAGWFGFLVSALSHLLVFLLFFVLLNLLAVLASWCPCPPREQFVFCYCLGALILLSVFRTIVFPAMSFNGFPATAYALSFSITVAAFLSSISLTAAARFGGELSSGLSVAFWMPRPRTAPRHWLKALLGVLVLIAAASVLAISTSRMDWNYIIQKITALIIWIAAFRLFFSLAQERHRAASPTGRLLACVLLLLPIFRVQEAVRFNFWKRTGNKLTVAQFLDRWAGYDVSFKLIHDLLTPEARDNDFYRFLVRNTNIPRSVAVAPTPFDLADLRPSSVKKPNIFIITIDSLRRDYLAPYNSQVDFTPSIDRFAHESIVMENAFTHYGGTGLSEPSIWVGGMLLHKQYVTPFASMNSLQKLLEAENYRAYVSRDSILETIVTPWPKLVELDKGTLSMNQDLCATLGELDSRLATDPGDSPIFSYTQPQNIHISVINREGAKAISGENYGSFYAPYASRLRRLDGCIGTFINQLKKRGLYDSSIVVLTADHGDSLGEQGRWGHAYTVYPEIMRIPLILHVPEQFRQGLYFDPKTIAFSTDITPSLYYLTGHKPVNHKELFGRSLFTEKASEQTSLKRTEYLVASSYAAVYGILSGDGKSLVVSDAVNYKDYGFDLSSFLPGTENLSGSAKTVTERLIKQKVLALDEFYGFSVDKVAGK
jgi:hypothetical protein